MVFWFIFLCSLWMLHFKVSLEFSLDDCLKVPKITWKCFFVIHLHQVDVHLLDVLLQPVVSIRCEVTLVTKYFTAAVFERIVLLQIPLDIIGGGTFVALVANPQVLGFLVLSQVDHRCGHKLTLVTGDANVAVNTFNVHF